jgi:2-hydroxy-6-oxonona-2,4-dienedioate hydrolase
MVGERGCVVKRARTAMTLERRIRAAESDVFGGRVEESFLRLTRNGLRVRAFSCGTGEPVILLHGVSLGAVAWAPLLDLLPNRRLIVVDLPGHGLSDPVSYRRGRVREHARQLIDDLFDALELERAPVVGHSLGAMFALWHAATGADRIAALVAVGDPAVALPGVRVRMPLSMLTVRGVGLAVLRSPSPVPVYRRVLAQGLGAAEVAGAPASMLDALRLSARRPENARTVASLMHAIDRFRRPRAESVLTVDELAATRAPAMFVWGEKDPYLSPEAARPSIERMPAATLRVVPGGHGPWLVDAGRVAELIELHLSGVAGVLEP